MLRELSVRLNPETVSWAAGFCLLEFGVASCLGFLGVGGGLVMAWMLVAGGVFAVCEPGLFAWLWVMVVTHDEEEPTPEKAAPEGAPTASPSDASDFLGKDDSGPFPSANSGYSPNASADPKNPELKFEEKLAGLIGRRSSNAIRATEVVVALALAVFAYFGSHWLPVRIQPPGEAALQQSIKQLDQDLKDSKGTLSGGNSKSDDNTLGGGFGGDSPHSDPKFNHLDPKFEQDLLAAIRGLARNPEPSWTGPSIFGISILVLLIIALGVALVFMFRRRPETAAPLGAVTLAATAIKEAEHLSRFDMTSFRIVEIAFIVLLGAFAGLAVWKIWTSWNAPKASTETPASAPKVDEQEKSKIESPLSLLFSLLVLLWALLAICYRQQQEAPVQPPRPSISLDLTLPSVSGFVPGLSDQVSSNNSLDEFKSELIKEHETDIKPDEVLLLLGSADCTAVRKSLEKTNGQLAQERAHFLAGVVQGMNVLPADHVLDRTLHQSDKCTESADLRAVFPVLIKLEKAGAAVR